MTVPLSVSAVAAGEPGDARARRSRAAIAAQLQRVDRPDPQGAAADLRLQLRRSAPSAMTLPRSMTVSSCGELLGLLHVLGGEQDGRARPRPSA